MCCIVAKYFDDTGWTVVKNRDRNYIPTIMLIKEDNLHLMVDTKTYYQEGTNSNGIGVVSSSLMVLDDEKEYRKKMLSGGKKSKDGERIKAGLLAGDIDSVKCKLIEEKLTGHTFICDRENLWVLEGAKDSSGNYHHTMRYIDRGSFCVRTNHGIDLDWAGYQTGFKRLSSERRYSYGKACGIRAFSKGQLIELMARTWDDNPQLNICRRSEEPFGMKTVGQVIISDQQLEHKVIYHSS